MTGMQHFLLAKMYWENLLAERGIEGKRVAGRMEDRREEGGKEMEGEKSEEEGKEEGAGEKKVEQGKEGEGKEEDKEKESVGDNELQAKEGEKVGERGKLILGDLEPTLERCKEALALSEDYGSRAYYFVNGALLSMVRCVQQQRAGV